MTWFSRLFRAAAVLPLLASIFFLSVGATGDGTSIDTALGAIAVFVHAHIAIVSVASALVILGLLLGDLEDFVLYGLDKGWRALLSLNVIIGILAGDAANATAAGAAVLAFLGALGAGASYRDAAVTALIAIGTVNTGYLLGADRQKLNLIIVGFGKRAPAVTAKT